MRHCIVFIFLLTLLPTAYAKRYALVIGNAEYSDNVGRLKNPVNDATDMATLLRRKQFSVRVLKNANKRQMKEGIDAFTRQLNQKDAVGLFFFAGQGVEVDGHNYLIPVKAHINSESDVEYESIHAGRVMSGMRKSGNNLNMVILDACRNNPYARSFRSSHRGLSRMDPPKGSLLLYATSPGEVALDGSGRNGLFTQHLLEALDTPNLMVEQVFKLTAKKVYQATNEQQLPWQSGVMLGDFYFSEYNPEPKPRPIPDPKPMRRSFEPTMVQIPGGQFRMGDIQGAAGADEQPVHRVSIRGFSMSQSEVSRGQFRAFVKATGYRTEAEQNIGESGCYAYKGGTEFGWTAGSRWQDPGFQQTDTHPVVCVSWNDAQAYIDWLNRETGQGYRLPSEAEWEYAARAGSEQKYSFGNTETQLCRHGNIADRAAKQKFPDFATADCNDGYVFTAPKDSFQANAFGLYDMHGNVWEWTQDCWNENYDNALSNNRANKSGDCARRVVRGGSWNNLPGHVRLAIRFLNTATHRNYVSGFRLAQD